MVKGIYIFGRALNTRNSAFQFLSFCFISYRNTWILWPRIRWVASLFIKMNVENVHLLSNHWKIKEVTQLLLNYKEQTSCRYNKVQLTFNIKDITKVATTIMVMTLMKVITTTTTMMMMMTMTTTATTTTMTVTMATPTPTPMTMTMTMKMTTTTTKRQ